MNAIQDSFRQLVDRKLWPIALLLVLGLVAVPFLMRSDAEETSLPVSTAVAPVGATDDASIVTVADPEKTDDVRAVLGVRKNPFRPAQLHRVIKPKDPLTTPGVDTQVNTGGGGDTAAGGGTTPDVGPVATATVTATPEPTYELYSLKVRFGPTDGDLTTKTVKRLTGLPNGQHPAALYLGLLEDHKSAVFILDAAVQPLGDGHCDPSPTNCQTLTMKEGETEFLTRGDKQYELDLVDIHVSKTTDKEKADASRKQVAASGRKSLRGMVSRVGAWSYDAAKGTLKKLAKKAQSERVAKFSRTASFTSTG